MQLVGRRSEVAGMDQFLGLLPEEPAALVLEGDRGIGKTAVWRAAVDGARGRSYQYENDDEPPCPADGGPRASRPSSPHLRRHPT